MLTGLGGAGGLLLGAGTQGCSTDCDIRREVVDIELLREDPVDDLLLAIGRVSSNVLDARMGYVAVGVGGGIWSVRGWTPLPSGTSADLLHVDAVGGWACGTGGTLLRADEAGASWVGVDAGTQATLRGVASLGQRVIAIGDGVARRSFDGGRSWKDVPGAVGLDLRFVAATADDSFVIGGADGLVFEVDDSGASPLPSPGKVELIGFAEGAFDDFTTGAERSDSITAANGDVFDRDRDDAWVRDPTGLTAIAASALDVVVGDDTIALRDDRGWQPLRIEGTVLTGVARAWFSSTTILEIVAVGRRGDRGTAVITRWTIADVDHTPRRTRCTVPV
jgi:hypothetical protein